MASQSTSCEPMELNEVLGHENIDEMSLKEDSIFKTDYVQLMTLGIHHDSDRVIMLVMNEKT
jgi:hypothetical protein